MDFSISAKSTVAWTQNCFGRSYKVAATEMDSWSFGYDHMFYLKYAREVKLELIFRMASTI